MREKQTPAASFTLVEVLTTVLLLGIIITGISLIRWSGNPAGNLRAGRQTAAALARAARAQAMLHRVPARLIVHAGKEDAERYLCFLAVVRRSGAAGGGFVWEPEGRGEPLPAGVRFWPEQSAGPGGEPLPEMLLPVPEGGGELEEGKGARWFYYEFTSGGEAARPGAKFSLAMPRLPDAGTDYVFGEDAPAAGFVIHKLGSLTFF